MKNIAHPIGLNQLSGVHEIPFNKENATVKFYIGMANRKLKTMIKEYIADIKYKKTKALARLYNKEPLQIDFNPLSTDGAYKYYSV